MSDEPLSNVESHSELLNLRGTGYTLSRLRSKLESSAQPSLICSALFSQRRATSWSEVVIGDFFIPFTISPVFEETSNGY
jgi:hypothetical protein